VTEETLAEEYAAKIKAVAETRDEEIEILYREYQTKWRKQLGSQGEEISTQRKASDSPVPDETAQSITHNKG
jgi:3-deoxy-D-arabino-heptulosonate 7-phosphate (DAHP) synthase